MAALLLEQFLVQLGGEAGLRSKQQAVRQACIDLLGGAAAALQSDAEAARRDAAWLQSAVQHKGVPSPLFGCPAHVGLLERVCKCGSFNYEQWRAQRGTW